ncbi:MAG: hypothetical protein ACM65M_07235 [Microcoleus sp.]
MNKGRSPVNKLIAIATQLIDTIKHKIIIARLAMAEGSNRLVGDCLTSFSFESLCISGYLERSPIL